MRLLQTAYLMERYGLRLTVEQLAEVLGITDGASVGRSTSPSHCQPRGPSTGSATGASHPGHQNAMPRPSGYLIDRRTAESFAITTS